MYFFNYWHYFFVNILGINFLPLCIKYNDVEWFSVLGKNDNEWYLCYSRYITNSTTEDAFGVVSKRKYFVFLKMLHVLWKNRNKIEFTIDSY